jgi:hypothetical protein
MRLQAVAADADGIIQQAFFPIRVGEMDENRRVEIRVVRHDLPLVFRGSAEPLDHPGQP